MILRHCCLFTAKKLFDLPSESESGLCVCPCCKRKTAGAINTKICSGIVVHVRPARICMWIVFFYSSKSMKAVQVENFKEKETLPVSVYPPWACRTERTQLAAGSSAGCSTDST